MPTPHGLDGARHCVHCAAPLQPKRLRGDHLDRLACPACGWVLYHGPEIAAGTVPLYEGRIVLIRRAVRPSKGLWTFPCGYMERDETLEEGARRETLEECGLEVELDGLLGAFSYPPGPEPGGRVVVVAYAAVATGGVPIAGDDADEVRLCDPDDLPWDELAFSSSRDALNAWLKRNRPPG